MRSPERRPSTTYLAPAPLRKHRYSLTTRTRLAGGFIVAVSVLLFILGEGHVVVGTPIPVRFVAVAILLYRGLPYLLWPRGCEGSAARLLGADAPNDAADGPR